MDFYDREWFLKKHLPQHTAVLMSFVHDARSQIEDRVLASLARIQVTIPKHDQAAAADFCIKEVIQRGDQKTKRIVLNFFGYGDTVSVPIEVTYSRQVIEEATYSGVAVVSVDDLVVDKDGTLAINPDATYHYTREDLKKGRQFFRGNGEARLDQNASWVTAWRKSDIRFSKNYPP
jgi:hypothetical protein